MQAVLTAAHASTGTSGEALYRHGPVAATYMHAYWPSNPAAAAALFRGESL
jgi:cobyrinic acid a,c-diamide synthase